MMGAAAAEVLPHKRRRLSEDISCSRCASPVDATSAQPATLAAAGAQQQAKQPAQQAHAHAQQPQAAAPAATCRGSSAEGQCSATHAEGAPQASAQPPQVLTEQRAATAAGAGEALPQQNGFARAAAATAVDCACESRIRSSGSDGSGGGGSAPALGLAAAGKKRSGSAAGSDVPLAQQKPYLCTGFDCYVVQVLTFLPL